MHSYTLWHCIVRLYVNHILFACTIYISKHSFLFLNQISHLTQFSEKRQNSHQGRLDFQRCQEVQQPLGIQRSCFKKPNTAGYYIAYMFIYMQCKQLACEKTPTDSFSCLWFQTFEKLRNVPSRPTFSEGPSASRCLNFNFNDSRVGQNCLNFKFEFQIQDRGRVSNLF